MIVRALALSASLLALSGCMNDTMTTAPSVSAVAPITANPAVGGAAMFANRNIIENAVQSPIHTTLVAAVKAAGLVDTLSGPGPFTVFAPTDAAFAKLPAGTVETLLLPENKAKLTEILTYHVVPANALSGAIGTMIADDGGAHPVTTVSGGTLIARRGANGTITLTDENGGVSTVTIADVVQSNGVIHVVDTVLLPADKMAKSAMSGGPNPMVGGAEMFESKNIVENALNSADHTTLVAAVKAAGLVDTLSGPGPFTVFAPTNAAFAKLPAGTVESLLLPENKAKLTQILTYHVVPGTALSTDIDKMVADDGGIHMIRSVAGNTLTARRFNGSLAVSDENGGLSYVTIPDVRQSNGVIHVVDTVLLPAN